MLNLWYLFFLNKRVLVLLNILFLLLLLILYISWVNIKSSHIMSSMLIEGDILVIVMFNIGLMIIASIESLIRVLAYQLRFLLEFLIKRVILVFLIKIFFLILMLIFFI